MALPRRTRRLLAALGGLIVAGAATVAFVELRYPEPRGHVHGAGFAPSGAPRGTGRLDHPTLASLVRVATGLAQPTDVAFLPGEPPWLLVLQKTGEAKLARFDREAAERAPIDVAAAPPWFAEEVETGSEMGLLGVALHPRFAENGRFFVHDNPRGARYSSRLAEWSADPARPSASPPRRVRTLLTLEQPYGNHKGGQIAFGPDGMLYVAFGDGGSGGDPHGNGQNLSTFLGKLLRIDVEHGDDAAPYAVPRDNPFVGGEGAKPEIFAYGLRNPWRFSFDARGRLVVADVGQNLFEEVDLVPRGANLGWNVREGRHAYGSPERALEGAIEPVFEYGHDVGSSVTGGYEYAGRRAPALRGRFLVTDFVSGALFALALPDAPGAAADARSLGRSDLMASTFGRAPDGEVYVADFSGGALFGFAPPPPPAPSAPDAGD